MRPFEALIRTEGQVGEQLLPVEWDHVAGQRRDPLGIQRGDERLARHAELVGHDAKTEQVVAVSRVLGPAALRIEAGDAATRWAKYLPLPSRVVVCSSNRVHWALRTAPWNSLSR